ncbi:X-Pro aminopeptidase [Pseudolabrys sp. Root1462]|uniref:aminopeptidase P family protein n=1 Tax=Pseudolabrys sp. Root1462 TaxID=1736466 RepID=UPI00070319F0|nr:aminopeptidase P family protein [Pseudolabrys sp. Root1462]KQY99987.1 X-Pro aminopeptidase [Pseudolabrys sp. Root1462]
MFEARFQTFDDAADGAQGSRRVAALRAELKRRGLDGFLVPRADRQQNEYLPASEERLAWLTGFTGSAGAAIVLTERAALFVDGRYTLQVQSQADTTVFTIEHFVDNPPAVWLESNVKAGDKIGFDPWLHTSDSAERFARACAKAGATLVPVEDNPIDALWTDRPAPPHSRVTLRPLALAGEAAADKLARITDELQKLRADTLIVSDPQNVDWTFNIRGSDVAHTPLALGFAAIPRDGRPRLYIEPEKLSNEVRHALEEVADVHATGDLARDLATYKDKTVLLDQASAADALTRIVSENGGKVMRGADPITLMKAVKNNAEIAGTRAAHLRDGAAMTRFLCWLDHEMPSGKLTEIEAVAALESFRRDSGLLKDVSFPSISGAGPNGAIVHYRVTSASNRVIGSDEMFLIDSGAQYEDGTTDITRTVINGTPTDEMRDRFTRVLKGHIAIAEAVFPVGTTGAQLDPLARVALWQAGLDFDHGTGHGVGSYLSVHEGPARISKLGHTPLKPGMILSNEPGYYKTGAYGIRIENLVLVIAAASPDGGEKPLNAFETLSFAPIDRRLVDPRLLTSQELHWLNNYHARVREAIMPLIDPATQSWLERATRAL